MKLGEILIESELITPEQLDEALEMQKKVHSPLGELLIKQGYISQAQLYKTLEYMLRVPYIDIAATTVDPKATAVINESFALKHMLIPIKKEGNTLTVVMRDPLNYHAVDELRALSGMDVKEAIASEAEIRSAIDRYYSSEGAQKAVEELKKEYNFTELSGLAQISDSEVSNASVVRLVNSIITQAIKSGASDIHIEPTEDSMVVRFRIDGELQEVMRTSVATQSAIVTRIKIIGGMDIAEKRIPQDGRVQVTVDNSSVDLRLSILPTVYGEKVVIRVLGQQGLLLTLESMGFSADTLAAYTGLLQRPHGVLLLTGPTGSGKTTTLYASLSTLDSKTLKIITVEDPVEYQLNGINQIQVQSQIDLSFARALRAILRQDPDIIMIGEMRDHVSLSVALSAAETGHLVLSTLHTNTASQAVHRILEMFPATDRDQVRFGLAANLRAVLCQRLIPSIRGGVVPAVEILVNTPIVRKLIRKNELDTLASAIETGEEDGMQTFNKSLYSLIKEGKITETLGIENSPNPEALRMNLQGIFLDEGRRILG